MTLTQTIEFFDGLVNRSEQTVNYEDFGHIKDFILDYQPKLLLDMACGDGIYSKAITEYFKDIDLVGFDISTESVRKARQKCQKSADFVVCSAEYVPFRSAFDLVIAINGIHHAGFSLIEAGSKSLKLGGILYINDAVIDNPIHFAARKLFSIIPRTIKVSRGDVTKEGRLPPIFLYSTVSLKIALERCDLKIVWSQRRVILAGIIGEALETFGIKSQTVRKIISVLDTSELHLLEKFPIFERMGAAIRLVATRDTGS